VTGQVLALIIVSQILGFAYPLMACGLAVLASVIVNIVVTLKLPLDRRVSDLLGERRMKAGGWPLP